MLRAGLLAIGGSILIGLSYRSNSLGHRSLASNAWLLRRAYTRVVIIIAVVISIIVIGRGGRIGLTLLGYTYLLRFLYYLSGDI